MRFQIVWIIFWHYQTLPLPLVKDVVTQVRFARAVHAIVFHENQPSVTKIPPHICHPARLILVCVVHI